MVLSKPILRCARNLKPRSSQSAPKCIHHQQHSVRSLTSSSPRSSAPSNHSDHSHQHESPYDPPGGWWLGVPPGQKYQKEGWEDIWIYGFWGSLVFGAVAYAYKPDTSIQTWALEEARRRLEAEGILEDPNPEGSK